MHLPRNANDQSEDRGKYFRVHLISFGFNFDCQFMSTIIVCLQRKINTNTIIEKDTTFCFYFIANDRSISHYSQSTIFFSF